MLNLAFPLHRLQETTQRLSKSEIAIASQPQTFHFVLPTNKTRYPGILRFNSNFLFDRRVVFHPITSVFDLDEEHTAALVSSVNEHVGGSLTPAFGFDNKQRHVSSRFFLARRVLSPLRLLSVTQFQRRSTTCSFIDTRPSIARPPLLPSTQHESARSSTSMTHVRALIPILDDHDELLPYSA